MDFRIDTHVHTSETSVCGQIPGADMVAIYADHGYDAIVICDHYYDGFFKQHGDGLIWPRQLDRYLAGYRSARQVGVRIGLEVFLGIELRLKGCHNDYLVFGPDETFLVDNPRLYELSLFEAHDLFAAAGFLFVQAHPFRPAMTPVNPCLIDGIEVVNGHPNHASDNPRALAYAQQYGFLRTGGSDAHFLEGTGTAGMVFRRRLASAKDLAEAIRAGERAEIFGPGLRLDITRVEIPA